jgi:hypothetical protein
MAIVVDFVSNKFVSRRPSSGCLFFPPHADHAIAAASLVHGDLTQLTQLLKPLIKAGTFQLPTAASHPFSFHSTNRSDLF